MPGMQRGDMQAWDGSETDLKDTKQEVTAPLSGHNIDHPARNHDDFFHLKTLQPALNIR